ncbi:hypothetical protein FKW77_001896 [Venturia effusa]|uniref:Uncharacterized protein n=1 Tax=Venturia effusa TaxID=50376 RepID=A0A517LJR0_9PEZI|nr:hypothetical protein FKW77_001896 [Venturia effusa]
MAFRAFVLAALLNSALAAPTPLAEADGLQRISYSVRSLNPRLIVRDMKAESVVDSIESADSEDSTNSMDSTDATEHGLGGVEKQSGKGSPDSSTAKTSTGKQQGGNKQSDPKPKAKSEKPPSDKSSGNKPKNPKPKGQDQSSTGSGTASGLGGLGQGGGNPFGSFMPKGIGGGGMPDLSAFIPKGTGGGGLPDLSALLPKGTGGGGMPDLSAFMPKSGGESPNGFPGLGSLGDLFGGLTSGNPSTSSPREAKSKPATGSAPKKACKPGGKWKRHGPCGD